MEANREFTLAEHSVVPYFNVEGFWDSRYDGLSRVLAQGGAEVTVDKHFRVELYLARQNDRKPSSSSLDALGIVAKWYY
jgi:hypothetical protein